MSTSEYRKLVNSDDDEDSGEDPYSSSKWPSLTGLLVILLAVCLASVTTFTFSRAKAAQEKQEDSIKAWKSPFISTSPLMQYAKTAVASDSEICSIIGNYIMTVKKGSAVDGAISTLLCLGISNMPNSGIGGGSFMLIYDPKSQTASGLDFREVAPQAASENMFASNPKDALLGGKASAVPSEIKGYYEAWRRFGRLEWKELFQPTIEMCKNGYFVSKTMGKVIGEYENMIRNDPGLSELLIDPVTNKVKKAGDTLKNPKLARTLETIADDPHAFYNGSLAATISRENQAAGGIITQADLQNYAPVWRTPIKLTLPNSNLNVYGMPIPSSGVVLAFILGVLDGYKFNRDTKADLNSFALYHHRAIESFKYAFAKRSALGDPAYNNKNVTEIANKLIDIDYINSIRQKIDDNRTYGVEHYGPSFQLKQNQGTCHLSLISPDGVAVSVTSTINDIFGSGVLGMETGILYNNQMGDFSIPNEINTYGLQPSPTNFIKPGKRAMSSTSPLIVTDSDGKAIYVSGASGGSKITTGVAYIASRVLFLGDNVKEATDYPRVHHQLLPNEVYIEDKFPEEMITILKKKGHKFRYSNLAVCQSVHRQDDHLHAHSDHRKGGIPSGQ